MKRPLFFSLLCLLTFGAHAAEAEKPLRALLVTGGCCHNYRFQTEALTNAVSKFAKVEWTIVNEGGRGTQAEIALYGKPDWAAGYDVVVHNECFADTANPEYIRRITEAHKAGVPAVVIHCAMHTYRAAQIDDWREFLGVTSRRHDHQSRYTVKRVEAEHPILEGMPEQWVTPMDELYVIEKVWPGAQTLATAVSEVDGKAHPVVWTHQYGKARVFGTTFGHGDDTFRDPVFLTFVSRGLLWAAGRL
ncbi:MAG TPA: ThuA domain-containing protein [Verrucomicrobia bacterium]|nr:ThuA domain-containing protein [Verrucomicrobiota bacterium]HOB31940.1 ThuA domain-containing protein [Verrucomicrobiota bacterium]HOP97701.1 ThuA domain-containing protein [Verrucomicrobiota bacterium]HPU56342.1 ThuA domain-containing protein [Verrucomicrobiota bacterium]